MAVSDRKKSPPAAAEWGMKQSVLSKRSAPRFARRKPPISSSCLPLAYAAVFTDSLFACSAKTVSKAISKFTKVYAYEFSDRDAPISFSAPKELGSFGAYHSAEIQYVLQTKSLFFAPEKMIPDQKKLADIMQVAWASFARDGVPSFPSGAKWPEFNPVKANIRRFATSGPETADDFEKFHKCEFWSAL